MSISDSVLIDVLEDDAGTRLADLHRWLRDDPELRPVMAAATVRPRPGEMSGDVGEMLIAAVTSKELLVALVSGLSGWLVARAPQRRTRVRVKCGEQEIEIDSAQVSDPEAAARRILRGMGQTHDGAAS